MIKNGEHEKKFLQELSALFTGAKTDGDSGFVNLMRVKNRYFEQIRPLLLKKIDEAVDGNLAFREELFEKLQAFFSRYFCESGSVYFRNIPSFYPAYERAYGGGGDMELVWKTRDLYYVKTDRLVVSIPVEWQGEDGRVRRFYFDAGGAEHKKNNERRDFVYEYAGREDDGTVNLKVSLSKGGTKTKVDEIIKAVKKDGIKISEDDLTRAFTVFKRQTEADFFIHKNASEFLREQFNLWMYQYIFREESEFSESRLAQLSALRDVALSLIDFIGQFEDELVRVWQKPKFVRDANYVVTADRLKPEVLKKLAKHAGAKKQAKEWQELGLVKEGFKFADILKGNAHKFLPLDTHHFKDMENDILACLGDLDTALDGELIKSDNWQALNVLGEKYKGRVKCIYIDPPFNLDSSDQFAYRTNYKNANWATMLENRLSLARDFLSNDGAIFVRCDYNGNWIVRCLLDKVFQQIRNEVFVRRISKNKNEASIKSLPAELDTLFVVANNDFCYVAPYIQTEHTRESFWRHMGDSAGQGGSKSFFNLELFPPEGCHWKYSQENIERLIQKKHLRLDCVDCGHIHTKGDASNGCPKCNSYNMKPKYYVEETDTKILNTNWSDIPGFSSGWKFSTENSEQLLYRVISISTNTDNLVFDFFAGSGTTQAVAQKLGRKWLGVEMGEHFDTVILPRLKKVLAGHKSGISKEVAYKGGGAFVYYALEQYEETLKNMRYKDGDLIDAALNKTPFAQYVFLTDDKLAHAVKVKGKGKNRKLDLQLPALYKDVALPETLANLRGSALRRKDNDSVTMANGETIKTNPNKMTEDEKMELIKILKPCLWWGE